MPCSIFMYKNDYHPWDNKHIKHLNKNIMDYIFLKLRGSSILDIQAYEASSISNLH